MKTTVKFVRHYCGTYGNFPAGSVASVPEDFAKSLVEVGDAVRTKSTPRNAPEVETPPEEDEDEEVEVDEEDNKEADSRPDPRVTKVR